MRILRLAIRGYKKFADPTVPVVIEGLTSGLTVLAGDNEEGKSTVLSALRTVLFDRHRVTAEVAQAMQPFGSKVQPVIEVEFEVGGQRYRLRKGFAMSAFAELEGPDGRYSGPAAEDALQKLLGFEPSKKGLAKDENQGVFGLLFIEQGRAADNLTLGAGVRQTLQSALESEVGAVLGGQSGQAVLQAVTGRYEQLFEKRDTARPKGEYKQALDRVAAVAAERERLSAELDRYNEQVDRLSREREGLNRLIRDGSEERAQRELAAAEAEQRRVAELDSIHKQAVEVALRLQAELKIAEEKCERREKELRSVERAQSERRRCGERAEEQREALAPLSRSLSQAEQELAAAQQAQRAAESAVRRAELRFERAKAAAELGDLKQRLQNAEAARRRSREARTRADAIAVDDRGLAKLRTLERTLRDAEAALLAVATRVTLAIQDEYAVEVGGQPARGTEELLLSEPTAITIAGVGALTIAPGKLDLRERTAHVESARQALAKALAALGCTDVAHAETLRNERDRLLREADEQTRIEELHAPETLPRLAQAVAAAEQRLSTVPEQEGGESIAAPGTPEQASEGLLQARATHARLTRSIVELQAVRDREDRALAKEREKDVRVQAELEAATQAVARAEQELVASRAAISDEEAQKNREALRAAGRSAEERRHAAHQALREADPERARLLFEQRRDALAAIQREIAAKRKQEAELVGELRSLSREGLGEKVQELDGELLRARAAAERVTREAEAVKLLYETLRGAEREAKEVFLSPILRRVRPYLNQLMPGSELALSESDLSISHLVRGGREEPFSSLSTGTREQLAVVVRLAFAELLCEKGVPAVVVLDDALVYADDSRFETMLLILRRAAQNMQILILTCRERDYLHAGAPIVRIGRRAA